MFYGSFKIAVSYYIPFTLRFWLDDKLSAVVIKKSVAFSRMGRNIFLASATMKVYFENCLSFSNIFIFIRSVLKNLTQTLVN